jgi:predicted O-linked N-acetylglucosamine transferase (SPINDLY family)
MVVVDVSTLLAEGLAAHQAGRLQEAERRYRRALTAQPEQPDALHLLAVALLQGGRAQDARGFARRATGAAPAQPTFWNTRGAAERAAGRHADAVESFRQAVALAPTYAEGWTNLAIACAGLGRADDEAAALARLTAVDPNNGPAWGRRGVLALDAGAVAEAEALLTRAVVLLPDEADLWCGLGNAQAQLGRLDLAEASQRRAIALRPDFVGARNNLGNLLVTAERWDEARNVLEQVVKLAPDYAPGWANLGLALRGLERYQDARAAFERSLGLQPALPLALIGLGDAYQGLRDYPHAIDAYEQALDGTPDNADLWKNYGRALEHHGRLAEAVEAYGRCLAIDPSRADIACARIFVLDALPITLETANAARRAWNDHHARPLAHLIRPHTNVQDPVRRLRIGYVSGDFRRHSAASIALAVLEHHDPATVEVVCYSNSPQDDDYTARFKAVASRWRQVEALSDEELAAQVRADGIDILVDLSGYSQGNRLPTFARKPAPIQVTAWGYATSTGLDTMDVFFADPVVVPAEAEPLYAEKIVHLPNVVCYTPPGMPPAISPLPARARGYVTFGSYNRALKITTAVLETWARVLQAVPDSRLILKPRLPDSEATRERILGPLVRNGIAPERVEILGLTSGEEHLVTFGQLDIQLDTFPHTGGVTTLDGLLMGVPVVTLLGERIPERLSASFLTTLGLEDLVAHSIDEYVDTAIRLAGDLDRLARERSTLRERLLASPIGDAGQYTRAVEAAYRGLWREWCAERAASRSPLEGHAGAATPAISRTHGSTDGRR